jgi:hypothetical protein
VDCGAAASPHCEEEHTIHRLKKELQRQVAQLQEDGLLQGQVGQLVGKLQAHGEEGQVLAALELLSQGCQLTLRREGGPSYSARSGPTDGPLHASLRVVVLLLAGQGRLAQVSASDLVSQGGTTGRLSDSVSQGGTTGRLSDLVSQGGTTGRLSD